jgi:hypothetical protein
MRAVPAPGDFPARFPFGENGAEEQDETVSPVPDNHREEHHEENQKEEGDVHLTIPGNGAEEVEDRLDDPDRLGIADLRRDLLVRIGIANQDTPSVSRGRLAHRIHPVRRDEPRHPGEFLLRIHGGHDADVLEGNRELPGGGKEHGSLPGEGRKLLLELLRSRPRFGDTPLHFRGGLCRKG